LGDGAGPFPSDLELIIQFHSELATCNAYIVFAHPHPDRSDKVAPILSPFEAAQKALEGNGSMFLDRLIRADTVRLPSSEALASATTALGKRDAWLPTGADPKTSMFVGGLDYAAKEEDVRVFFEELVKAERGPPETRWVTGVRIVRDKATQLGKGFGYVHFVVSERS
jgi:nucleolar protein 12